MEVTPSRTSAEPVTRRVLTIAATAACFGAAALAATSFGGTGDTPCGPLVSPNFASGPAEALTSEGLCAIVHRSVAATATGLVVVAAVLLLIARRSSAPGRPAFVTLVIATLVAGSLALVGVSIGSSGAGETMQRGWAASREVVAWCTVGFATASALVLAVARSERSARSATSPAGVRSLR